MTSDEWEQSIRDNAVAYNVVMFQPGTSSKVYQSFEELDHAIIYSRVTLEQVNRIRSAMIYAISEEGRHALVGTMNRNDLNFKEVQVKQKGKKNVG